MLNFWIVNDFFKIDIQNLNYPKSKITTNLKLIIHLYSLLKLPHLETPKKSFPSIIALQHPLTIHIKPSLSRIFDNFLQKSFKSLQFHPLIPCLKPTICHQIHPNSLNPFSPSLFTTFNKPQSLSRFNKNFYLLS